MPIVKPSGPAPGSHPPSDMPNPVIPPKAPPAGEGETVVYPMPTPPEPAETHPES